MVEKADEILAEEIETPEEMILTALLTEIGGQDDVTVSIYRAGTGYHAKQPFITTLTPEEFSLELLRDKYQGGDFRIHVKQNGRLLANKPVSVEKQPDKTDLDSLMEKMNLFQAQNNPPQSMEGLDRLADAMTNGFSRMAEMMLQMNSNQPPPINPAEQMTATLSMMASMKEIMKSDTPAVNPYDGILKGIELAKEIVPSDGESNTWDVLRESIKTFGKPIAEMASKMNGRTMPANAPINYLPAGLPPGSYNPNPAKKPAPNQQPRNEAEMFKMMVQHQINMLLKQAKKGSDPGLYADLILDQLPPDKIKLFLGSEDWFQKIMEIVPEVEQYQPWFTELRNFVMDALTPEQEQTIPNTTDGKVPPIMMQAAGLDTYSEYDETGSGDDFNPDG